MRFTPTPLAGSYLIDLDKREDERGFFARFFCEREFGEAGLETRFVQINNSLSRDRGTLRGMHYQIEPSAEVKVVRALRGALWDAILDLRPESPTFGRSFGAELTSENRRMMYVPRGFAHGFLTLEPDSEALYLVSAYYDPGREGGVRWNDPRFSIAWPEAPSVISDKDANQPDFGDPQVARLRARSERPPA
jgi:dTDP-4-dehydrorhamnose 3,5-epimerase